MWNSRGENPRLEAAQCPVCHAILGQRNVSTIFMAHCEECRATFTWKMSDKKPTVILDKDIQKIQRYCGPDGCRCHT